MGGATPGDKHPLRLFENPGHGNDWINLKLVGTRTNRGAVGARIRVTVTDENGRSRSIHRVVTSGGSFGGSPLQQHVGLGRDARTIEVDVVWPTSGATQQFTALAPRQTYVVTEGSNQPAQLQDRRPVRLGGAPGRSDAR